MFYNDHPPPHFHARYGEFEATIEIETGRVLEGYLPGRALSLIEEWVALHKEQLIEDWGLCRTNLAPAKIDPLP